MSVKHQEHWITGDEFARERRRLIEAGVPDGAPEFLELRARMQARNDDLYQRFGLRHREGNEGRWIAISGSGDVILGDTAAEVLEAARERFGPGNSAIRKLADFPGHVFDR
jgi:hypothetical protein